MEPKGKMMQDKDKSRYYDCTMSLLNEKVTLIEKEIALAKESRDNEGKSSAGDKYETSRAMLHIDISNKENQLSEYMSLVKILSEVDMSICHEKVGFGALVHTSNGTFFISAALGKVAMGKESFFAISMASPLGLGLKGLTVGESVSLNGRTFDILSIA